MTEAWLSGPVSGVPRELQPAAHALLHAREDIARALGLVPADKLWEKAGAAPSVGFHVLHACGALDRLLTYARGEQLSDAQRDALKQEPHAGPDDYDSDSLRSFALADLDSAIAVLRNTDPARLYDPRAVGRQMLPSNVAGLLFHAAEHTARHAGQAISTARFFGHLAVPPG